MQNQHHRDSEFDNYIPVTEVHSKNLEPSVFNRMGRSSTAAVRFSLFRCLQELRQRRSNTALFGGPTGTKTDTGVRINTR